MDRDDKSDEVERVRREEEQRGKRRPPPAEEKLKARRELRKQWREILQTMTWKEVSDALGLQPGTAEYDDFYRTWRDYQRGRAEAEKKPRWQGPGKP